MNYLFLKGLDVHSDWNHFLSNKNLNLIREIENEVVKNGFTPPAEKVLRFLSVPLSTAKIIILGQDPYPQPGVATGRAFEVGDLKSWSEPFKNVSLKNILRAVYKAYSGKIISFGQFKTKLDNEFPVLPPGKFFENWERQGIVLLNTSFTCESGFPGSHQKIWESFTSQLLEFVKNNSPQATWFLWGKHAFDATKNLDLDKTIRTFHPMMCYDMPGREMDFLFGKQNCFEPFIPEIDWTGFGLTQKAGSSQLLF